MCVFVKNLGEKLPMKFIPVKAFLDSVQEQCLAPTKVAFWRGLGSEVET